MNVFKKKDKTVIYVYLKWKRQSEKDVNYCCIIIIFKHLSNNNKK